MVEVEEKKERVMEIEIGGEMEDCRGIYEGRYEGKARDMVGLEGWLEEQGEGKWTIIGGDFNARIGNLGGGIEEGVEEGIIRKSKNGKINEEERKILGGLEKRGWGILNGTVEGDEEGEYTYTEGRRESVIDYVIGEEKVRRRVMRREVDDCIESDHHPLVFLEGKGGRSRGIRRGNKEDMGEVDGR